MRERPLHIVVLRWFFTALLLASAIGKLLDIRGFAAVVGTYQVFPEPLLLPLGLALALFELALGLWLIWGRHLVWAALVIALLHAGYLAWLGLAYARGLDIPNCGCFGVLLDIPNCGCFGVFLARPLTPWMFVEDGLLLAAALFLRRGLRRERGTA
jgi:hypothetical protein